MSRRRPYNRRQKKPMEFLWPFLLIILVGIIVVLLIQFVFSWLDQRETEFKNKIYLYLDRGSAQILPWGDTEWTKAYHGQLVLEGDRLMLEEVSRGVLAFYDGTVLRLGPATKVEMGEIVTEEEGDAIHLDLDNGNLWVNLNAEADVPLRFIVETDNLRITSYGTVFEVSLTDRETVRVLEGEVLVEVLDATSEDREVVLEQVKVGVGQQVELTSSEMEDILAHKSVSLLEAIDDEWKTSEWYVWNQEEDAHPTVYGDTQTDEVAPEDSVVVPDDETIDEADEEVSEDDEEQEEVPGAPVVTITFPEDNPYTLDAGITSVAITGTTSVSTAKVTVTSYDEAGNPTSYVLSGYMAGSTTWRYNAAVDYNNLREGRNLFTVVSETAEGVKSDPIDVVVQVPDGAFSDEDEEAVEEDTSTEDEDDITVSDEPLSTPQVTSLNGESLPADGTYTTSAETVTIFGSVSTSAVAVYVNDFKLSKYQAGSGSWSYYAQPDFGNYDPGTNSFTVYVEDAEGNKSAVFSFTIYREAP